MVDQVLNGTPIRDIPVKVFKDDLNIYVNEDVMHELDITLPETLLQDKALKLIEG